MKSQNCMKSLKIPTGIIRNCQSKDRQYNGKKEKVKRTSNDLQNTQNMMEHHEPHCKPGVNSGAQEGFKGIVETMHKP